MSISVIIPALNEESYIEGCLQALKQQTLTPHEIIVVDNGSTDRTAERVRAAGARLIECPKPGVAHARQAGLLVASGDWVATTDADSKPCPEWLELLAPHMANSVALYGPLRMIGLPPWQEELSEVGYSVFLKLMVLLGKPNLAGANMAFDRRVALEVGGYPVVEAAEDVKLGLALKTRGVLRYVPTALVYTSARRVKGNWPRFFWQQLKNLAGNSSGYFAGKSQQ
jgi:glycosyltransferase involved in cell wall biosynthesis